MMESFYLAIIWHVKTETGAESRSNQINCTSNRREKKWVATQFHTWQKKQITEISQINLCTRCHWSSWSIWSQTESAVHEHSPCREDLIKKNTRKCLGLIEREGGGKEKKEELGVQSKLNLWHPCQCCSAHPKCYSLLVTELGVQSKLYNVGCIAWGFSEEASLLVRK